MSVHNRLNQYVLFMEQDDFLARKEQILNRNSAKNFKEFNIENELKKCNSNIRVCLVIHKHRIIARTMFLYQIAL